MKGHAYLITTCCKEKDISSGLLPAIERYKSERIRNVFLNSERMGLPMLIFSGKFGLLEPVFPIPFYDKKLEMEDLPQIIPLLKEHLLKFHVENILFYGCGENAEGWAPYYKAIDMACKDLGIHIEHFFSDPD